MDVNPQGLSLFGPAGVSLRRRPRLRQGRLKLLANSPGLGYIIHQLVIYLVVGLLCGKS